MSNMKREGQCNGCGECCKVFRVTGILSNIISQHGSIDEARAYYSFHGAGITQVDYENDTACLEMNTPCSQLDKNNRCRLHETPEKKPVICHRYPLCPDDIETCGYRWS